MASVRDPGCPECRQITSGDRGRHGPRIVRAQQATGSPDPPQPFRCPICGGRGVVVNGFYDGLSVGTDTLSEPCRSCNGSGVVWR